jgi:hypothetical protein
MATERFANRPITTLNVGVDSSETSLVVTDPSLFPGVPQFRILIEDEIMLVNGVSGSTYSVSRGAEGTTASSHLSGVAVIHILTAGALDELRSASGLRSDTTIVNVDAATAPTTGQMLVATDSTHATWQTVSSGGPKTLYLPLMSGLLPAGSTYTLLGLLPPLDYSTLGVGSVVFSFVAYINVPSASTAQVRLYDVTNSNTIFESSIISGPQVEYNAGDTPIVLAAGVSMLEFWLSTPNITGGSATCFAAGILAVFS